MAKKKCSKCGRTITNKAGACECTFAPEVKKKCKWVKSNDYDENLRFYLVPCLEGDALLQKGITSEWGFCPYCGLEITFKEDKNEKD